MPVFGAIHSLVVVPHGGFATGLLTVLQSGLFTQVAKAGTAEKIINIAAVTAITNFFIGNHSS